MLRVLADRPRTPARFLVLGSASPDLLRQTSESLAGRIHYHRLPGLSLDELGPKNLDRLWIRGGFPRSLLAKTVTASHEWRLNFIQTFLQRDVSELGFRTPSGTLRRFWSMLAHYHGQVWNASEIGGSLGVTNKTVRHYLDILRDTFVARILQPWHENLKKRQVKAPKVYVADSGLLHALLNLPTKRDLLGHPKAGASWEGFLLEEVSRRLGARLDECYFWATHTGAELDLFVIRGRHRQGFEFKRTVAPKVTKSMRIAIEDLKLKRLDVVYAGTETFALDKKIRALSCFRLQEDLKPLG